MPRKSESLTLMLERVESVIESNDKSGKKACATCVNCKVVTVMDPDIPLVACSKKRWWEGEEFPIGRLVFANVPGMDHKGTCPDWEAS